MDVKGKSKVDDISSTGSTSTNDKGKEIWQDDEAASAALDWLPGYPRRRHRSIVLGDLPPQPQEDQSSAVLTPDQPKVPANVGPDRDTNSYELQTQLYSQTPNGRSFVDLLLADQDFDLSTIGPQDTNEIETVELKHPGQVSSCENIASDFNPWSGLQWLGVPAKVEQDTEIAVLNKHGDRGLPVQSSSSRSALWNFANPHSPTTVLSDRGTGLPAQSYTSSSSCSMARSAPEPIPHVEALTEACLRAWFDPDQDTAHKLRHESFEVLKNHYAPEVEMLYSMRNPANTNALGHSGGRLENIHPSGAGLNDSNSEYHALLQQIKDQNHSIRLIHTKGHIPALSANPFGSKIIQHKLGTATTGEIIMVYQEVTPHVCTLAMDVFANYVIQKLLEHGPPFYTRKLVSKLLGNVIRLSLNVHGCRVIQKAFQIGDLGPRIEMAKELGSNLLRCACHKNANHVVQKCIERVPLQCIHFIYKSLCENAAMLASHRHGFRVIQKALEVCDDPQIVYALVSEIIKRVKELSADEFGSRVVQYIVEHGGPPERQIIVLSFAGRFMQMSFQKHCSNVIEKCLVHGSYHDRLIITTEILCAGGGRTAGHLMAMMVDQNANYVIQKMVECAEEWQFNVISDMVMRNTDTLVKFNHGRQLVTQVEKLLNARATLVGSFAPPIFPH